MRNAEPARRSVLREHRSEYDRVIYVGNGYSDVCPAKDADLVFAKDVLYDTCGQDGTACVHYENFQDILTYLDKTLCLEWYEIRCGTFGLPIEKKPSPCIQGKAFFAALFSLLSTSPI